MFELPQDKKQASTERHWIILSVVVMVAVVGTLIYMVSRSPAKYPAPAARSAAVPAKGKADAVRDLKVTRATMDKDRTGTTALWLVSIENRSAEYIYSDIHYETTYIGANSQPLLVNQGTIAISIGPGERKDSELRDALYPTGTAWYKFRITGATPAMQ